MLKKVFRSTAVIFGMLFIGALGAIDAVFGTKLSKSDSLLVPTASADVPCNYCDLNNWTQAQCDFYFAGGGCYTCFPEGTPVSTPNGERAIETLSIGDQVYGYDVKKGEVGVYPVTATMKHHREGLRKICPLIIITHEKGMITLTDNHRVYHRNQRDGYYADFDRAALLRVGDLLKLKSGEEVRITGIDKGPEYECVYNIGVKDAHTYFASGIAVHNSDSGCSDGDGNPNDK